MADVQAMLDAPPIDADWPLYAAGAIKGSFYVPEMSRDERRAWLASFSAALGDLPRPFVDEGFLRVLRRGGAMRPTPGDIYVEAKRLRDDAEEALKMRRDPPRPRPPEDEPGPVVSPEEQERIVARLKQLGQKLRWSKTYGRSDPEDMPEKPRRRTDREIQAIIDANPARHGQTVASFRAAEERP